MSEEKPISKEKLLNELKELNKASRDIEEIEVAKIKEYHRGYRDGMNTVINIIRCKNCEEE